MSGRDAECHVRFLRNNVLASCILVELRITGPRLQRLVVRLLVMPAALYHDPSFTSNYLSFVAFNTWCYLFNKRCHTLSSASSSYSLKSRFTLRTISSTIPNPSRQTLDFGVEKKNKYVLLTFGDCAGCVVHRVHQLPCSPPRNMRISPPAY